LQVVNDDVAKRKGLLNQDQAREIFSHRPQKSDVEKLSKSSILSQQLAERFGVTSKTIRDIWNGRTWKLATSGRSAGTNHDNDNDCGTLPQVQVGEILW
jgi:hypothetical protein